MGKSLVGFCNMKAKEDKEIVAIAEVYDALKELDAGAQQRVVDYVAKKLGISASLVEGTDAFVGRCTRTGPGPADVSGLAGEDDLTGISPISKRWMQGNG